MIQITCWRCQRKQFETKPNGLASDKLLCTMLPVVFYHCFVYTDIRWQRKDLEALVYFSEQRSNLVVTISSNLGVISQVQILQNLIKFIFLIDAVIRSLCMSGSFDQYKRR